MAMVHASRLQAWVPLKVGGQFIMITMDFFALPERSQSAIINRSSLCRAAVQHHMHFQKRLPLVVMMDARRLCWLMPRLAGDLTEGTLIATVSAIGAF